jgi:hypothetical protein
MRGKAAFLLILLGGLIAATAAAEPRRDRGTSMEFRTDRNPGGPQGMSMRDAADRAQRKHGGRVLAIDQDGFGGYRVKLLKDGEVRTVHVSPD